MICKKGEGSFSEVLKCQNVVDGTYWACKKMKQKYDRYAQKTHCTTVFVVYVLHLKLNVFKTNR